VAVVKTAAGYGEGVGAAADVALPEPIERCRRWRSGKVGCALWKGVGAGRVLLMVIRVSEVEGRATDNLDER